MGAIEKPNTIADNILLLGCSLFLILEAYLQYQYQIFGTRYGNALEALIVNQFLQQTPNSGNVQDTPPQFGGGDFGGGGASSGY